MTLEIAQAVYLDDGQSLTIAQLVERSGLTETELADLADCGALAGVSADAVSLRFDARCVIVARTARRLREQYALDDSHSLAIVVRLTQRIEMLEARLRVQQSRD
ncbi:MAG: hypothetical protein ABI812_02210 [Betaproteobacteria bacterium]